MNSIKILDESNSIKLEFHSTEKFEFEFHLKLQAMSFNIFHSNGA
jgi:hypothetical protein